MRLIDANKIKNCKIIYPYKGEKSGNAYVEVIDIDDITTAYDINKVARQLEEEIEHSYADFEQYAKLHGIDSEDDWFYAGLKRAIEIVKTGGIDE